MIPINSKPIVPALNMSGLREDALDTYAEEKKEKLTGNALYPDPFPEKDAMISTLAEYRIALGKADDGDSIDTDEKNLKKELLENSLVTLAFRCAQLASGNVHMFLTSGFTVRKPNVPHAKPEKPQDMEAFDGQAEGATKLAWSRTEGAVVSVIEMTETPQNISSWAEVPASRGGLSTKSETLITGLTPGKRYWFRVTGFNSAGLGETSEPATRISQ